MRPAGRQEGRNLGGRPCFCARSCVFSSRRRPVFWNLEIACSLVGVGLPDSAGAPIVRRNAAGFFYLMRCRLRCFLSPFLPAFARNSARQLRPWRAPILRSPPGWRRRRLRRARGRKRGCSRWSHPLCRAFIAAFYCSFPRFVPALSFFLTLIFYQNQDNLYLKGWC